MTGRSTGAKGFLVDLPPDWGFLSLSLSRPLVEHFAKHEDGLRYPTMIDKPIKRVDVGTIGDSPCLLHLGESGQIQLEVRFGIAGWLL